jgi:YegS/Rv2252/BmrU family lipid kinase
LGRQADRVFTDAPGHATVLAGKASTEYDVLVPVGGDGTVTEVAAGILSTESASAALGVLPVGTGNDIASVLGIRSPADTLRSLQSQRVRSIDVIRVRCQVNGKEAVRHALLFAGVGIISSALRRTTPRLKRVLGRRLSYPVGLLRALLGYRAPRMHISFDGQQRDERFLFVGASNSAVAGGGLQVAPGAELDDGLLNLNLIGKVPRWKAPVLLQQVSRGRHIVHPHVEYVTAHSLLIREPAGLEVAADGDLVGHTPAEFRVQPKALRVIGN